MRLRSFRGLAFGALVLVLVFAALAAFGLSAGSAWATGGVTVSPGVLTIEAGSSKTFTVAATNAIGDVMIVSSNVGVARANVSEWGTGMVDEGQTKSGEVTVTGVSEGNATITLTIDAATFDGEDLAGQTRTVVVNVVKAAEVPAPVPSGGVTGSSSALSSGSSSGVVGVVSEGSESSGSAGSSGSVSSSSSGSTLEDGDKLDEVALENGSEGDGSTLGSGSASKSGSTARSSSESSTRGAVVSDGGKGGLSVGVILAGVGAVAVVAALIGGAVWFVRKNR